MNDFWNHEAPPPSAPGLTAEPPVVGDERVAEKEPDGMASLIEQEVASGRPVGEILDLVRRSYTGVPLLEIEQKIMVAQSANDWNPMNNGPATTPEEVQAQQKGEGGKSTQAIATVLAGLGGGFALCYAAARDSCAGLSPSDQSYARLAGGNMHVVDFKDFGPGVNATPLEAALEESVTATHSLPARGAPGKAAEHQRA